MSMDDVACITALAAAIVSIGIGAASVLGHNARLNAALAHERLHATSAQECPHAHSTSTMQLAPPTSRAL